VQCKINHGCLNYYSIFSLVVIVKSIFFKGLDYKLLENFEQTIQIEQQQQKNKMIKSVIRDSIYTQQSDSNKGPTNTNRNQN